MSAVITCPAWCGLTPAEHVVEHDDLGKVTYHRGEIASGRQWEVAISGSSDQPGEAREIVVYVRDYLTSAEALEVAQAITTAVKLYQR
ncbi:MAG TPA: hypothetical protein VGK78_14745 [Nocardioides sp.]|uniref:hypothetical protein n=1 Tax=Nocardioides sp. TaxID=35761 RepID=UPI002F40F219